MLLHLSTFKRIFDLTVAAQGFEFGLLIIAFPPVFLTLTLHIEGPSVHKLRGGATKVYSGERSALSVA